MYEHYRILAVIPGRGGSKGIPRKNVRLLAGKPLIAYSIQTALQSKYVDDVVVSTEDAEIAEIARNYGSRTIRRPKHLAEDDVPLDPVIFHALKHIESRKKVTYDYVISMQPTSPLLKTETLDRAIVELVDGGYDTLITVKDATHLYWTREKGKLSPLYDERKNRQLLDPIFRETGALIITKRDVITENNRIGPNVHLFEVPKIEDIDIDTYRDWWVAENLLRKLKVIFRVDGDEELGLGHVYRAITLANRMFNQDLCFLMEKSKRLGIAKVGEYNYERVKIADQEDVFLKLDELRPDIVINDVLDTGEEYISRLKRKGFFIVNFEDLGAGADYADVVVNALYEKSEAPDNSYYGYKYACLRDEFFIFTPKRIEKKVKEILLLFGGSDPNNLTLRSINAVEKLNLKNISVIVVVGLGYKFKKELETCIDRLKDKGFKIVKKENVKTVAKLLSRTDLVVTSNGRTIYEVAAMAVPCISISQNEREVRHLFSHTCKGIINLGIAFNVSAKDIASALKRVLDDYSLRQKMSSNLKTFDLRKGTDRVLRLIFDRYWEKRYEENQDWQ